PSWLSDYRTNLWDHWSAHDYIFGKDGTLVTQRPDFSGSRFLVNRTDTDKPTVSGETTRGYPAAHFVWSGGQEYVDTSPGVTIDGWTHYGVIKRKLLDSSLIGVHTWQGFGALEIKSSNQNTLTFRAKDDDGAADSSLSTSNVDPTSWVAFVYSVSYSNQRHRVVLEDATGTTETLSATPAWTSTFDPSERRYRSFGGGSYWDGLDEYSGIIERELSNSAQDGLLSDIVRVSQKL
ncbi:MAG: hypothetical protein ABEN55_13570, partial [Bradymonadaceae bacterium]